MSAVRLGERPVPCTHIAAAGEHLPPSLVAAPRRPPRSSAAVALALIAFAAGSGLLVWLAFFRAGPSSPPPPDVGEGKRAHLLQAGGRGPQLRPPLRADAEERGRGPLSPAVDAAGRPPAPVARAERAAPELLKLRAALAEERRARAAAEAEARHAELELEGVYRRGRFSVHRGLLMRGDDLLGSQDGWRRLTIGEAKEACANTAACVGFTFTSGGAGTSGTHTHGRVRMYFKSKWHFTAVQPADPEQWWSYKVEERPPPFEPPAPPAWASPEALDKLAPRISATYDWRSVIKSNGKGVHQLQWPEYSDPEFGQAFTYPEPSERAILVSYAPRIYVLPDFVTQEEATEIIEVASHRLRRSEVTNGIDDKKKKNTTVTAVGSGRVSTIRTSKGAWLDDSVPMAKMVRDRIQELTAFPRQNFEQMQVLKYETGQKYVSHFDFFNPSGYGKQNWNRAITCFLALSDVDRGGETTFPQAHGAIGIPGDENGCSTGLQVKQVKGSAVLFYDMRPDYNLDPFSRHGGCPVNDTHGAVKWVSPNWLRVNLVEPDLPEESRDI